jgi:hypothetical protein
LTSRPEARRTAVVTRIAPLLLLVSLAAAPLPAWAQQWGDQITRDVDAAKTD